MKPNHVTNKPQHPKPKLLNPQHTNLKVIDVTLRGTAYFGLFEARRCRHRHPDLAQSNPARNEACSGRKVLQGFYQGFRSTVCNGFPVRNSEGFLPLYSLHHLAHRSVCPETLNAQTLNPKTLKPKPLNPKAINLKPSLAQNQKPRTWLGLHLRLLHPKKALAHRGFGFLPREPKPLY